MMNSAKEIIIDSSKLILRIIVLIIASILLWAVGFILEIMLEVETINFTSFFTGAVCGAFLMWCNKEEKQDENTRSEHTDRRKD